VFVPTARFREHRRAAALAAVLLLLIPSGPPIAVDDRGAAAGRFAAMGLGAAAGDDAEGPQLHASLPPECAIVRETRPDPSLRPPSRRLPGFAIEPVPDPARAARGPTVRPDDGVDVPACRSAGLWCLAHATSTSPA